MRTAIVSDLHLGSASREDLLRYPEVRRVLMEEIGDADRLVLLGDVVELRDLRVGTALEVARPFFEEVGRALADREVVLVPGNHDHRLAEDVLDDACLSEDEALGLECSVEPSTAPTQLIQRWLGGARLRIAYPGMWLRDDVYATHGHYMDVHLSLPRAECIAAVAMSRAIGSVPASATPADYERVLRPIYGFFYALAQSRPARHARSNRSASEAVWEILAGLDGRAGPRRRALGAAVRAGFPVSVWTLNRLLKADFKADVSAAAIFATGLEGAREMAAHLGVDHVHTIVGHTHRGGPYEREAAWMLDGGGCLHNSGSWFFAKAFHRPGTPPSDYWPGTVIWVEETGPPRPRRLLMERTHAEMAELISRATRR
jgi:predicted phosphodiesterase